MKINMNNNRLAKMFTIISIFDKGCKETGLITALIPKMKNTLNIFDPTIFPIAKSTFFFLAAITLVASSGRDVPIDTIVKAITLWESPIADATSTAETTIMRPPATRRTRPARIKNTDLATGLSFTIISSVYCSDFKRVIL
jgi:hypothetical protein